MKYIAFISLTILLLYGCQVVPTNVKENIDIEIWQKGVQILPAGGMYKLKKEEFDLKIVFTDQFSVLVNAHSTDESYIQANSGVPLDKIIGFSTTGMAEGIFNDKLNVTISRESPNFWYFDSQNSSRCNKTEKRGEKIICIRTIKNITYQGSNTISIGGYPGSELFLVFIGSKYDRTNGSNIELYRNSVHLRFESEMQVSGVKKEAWLATLKPMLLSNLCTDSPIKRHFTGTKEECASVVGKLFDNCANNVENVKIPLVLGSREIGVKYGGIMGECIAAYYFGGEYLVLFNNTQELFGGKGELTRETQSQMFIKLWLQTCAKSFSKPDEIRAVAKKYRFEENPSYAKNYLKGEKGTVWDVSLGPHTQQTLVLLDNGSSCRVYSRRAASQPINMIFEKVLQGSNKPGVAVEKIVDKEFEQEGIKLKQIAYYASRTDQEPGWVFIATTSDSDAAGNQATITVNRSMKPELNGDGLIRLSD